MVKQRFEFSGQNDNTAFNSSVNPSLFSPIVPSDVLYVRILVLHSGCPVNAVSGLFSEGSLMEGGFDSAFATPVSLTRFTSTHRSRKCSPPKLDDVLGALSQVVYIVASHWNRARQKALDIYRRNKLTRLVETYNYLDALSSKPETEGDPCYDAYMHTRRDDFNEQTKAYTRTETL